MASLLEISQLKKEYPGVVAVDGLSFSLEEGEVLSLVGENGAGKSTAMKMIGGVERPDAGNIYMNGTECHFKNPHEANGMGIGVVFQELSLVDTLSIAENIYMNRQPANRLGSIDFKKMNNDTIEILKIFQLDLKPQTIVSRLSAGEKQMIEILKAISLKPKILILDEPTSSLTDIETEELFSVMNKLKEQKLSFIYISHKMNEIFEISDKVVVLRDGKFVAEDKIEYLDVHKIVSLMVGREIVDLFGGTSQRGISDKILFSVKNLSHDNVYQDISFSLKEGEIVGFFGLIGAGRTEMAEGLFGITKKDSGKVILDGTEISINKPLDAIKNKLGYITEDRKELGLYLEKSIKDNLIACRIIDFSNKIGSVQDNKIESYAGGIIEKYNVIANSNSKDVVELSGGNQQKILLAMWMELNPKVLIFDEPTRGVDIGAKSEIYANIKHYSAEGNGAIVISSDTTELMGICDRIYVMRKGKIVGELEKKDFTEEKIVGYATGIIPGVSKEDIDGKSI